jgi:drug/metabolite transporter (DMT)-like permease
MGAEPAVATAADGVGAAPRPTPNFAGQIFLYALMCAIWGSSYFFTRIALTSFNPVTIPALRMMIAALALALIVALRRLPLPRSPAIWGHLLVLGAFNIALPYVLLTWAQTRVNSSSASILSATTPLFVFLFAWLVARTERFNPLRAVGLVLAFAGIAALYGFEQGLGSDIGPWSLVIVLCSIFYAGGNVYTRRFITGVPPFVVALLQIGIGAIDLVAAGLATHTLTVPVPTLPALLALLELGLAGSALTYVLFFHFIQAWGSTATSLNTYFQPLVGISLGILILHETLNPMSWLALGSVLLGVMLFGLGSALARRRLQAGPLANDAPASTLAEGTPR